MSLPRVEFQCRCGTGAVTAIMDRVPKGTDLVSFARGLLRATNTRCSVCHGDLWDRPGFVDAPAVAAEEVRP